MLDLQEIKDYLFCSLWYYLKNRPSPLRDETGQERKLPAYTTLDLPGLAITQALRAHLTGRYPQTFPELVSLVWEAWFTQKGVGEDVAKSLHAYAGIRSGILAQFLSGKITNPEHKKYTEPRMTNRYKTMMNTSGLLRIAKSVDEAALAKLDCAPGDLSGVGPYSLADAYTDSLFMASHYTSPLRETIYGLHVPTLVPLANHQTISAQADLVLLGEGSSSVEVHDFSPALYFPRSWVGRRLEVIAALQMVSADPAKPFPPVERVVYRHFMSGHTLERKSVRPARLIFALDAARRGIESDIFTPQFLSGDLSRCRQCPAQEICLPASGDLSEWFMPGEADIAARVVRAAERMGPVDRETVQKLSAALDEGVFPTGLLNILDALERSRNGW